MNKRELVALLDKYPDDMRIYVDTDEAIYILSPEHFRQQMFPSFVTDPTLVLMIDLTGV